MAQGRCDLEITLGDRRPSLVVTLREYKGGPLVTLTTPTLKLVDVDSDDVKIDYAAMTIVGPGVARYDWATGDVDEEGDFALWVRDVDATGLPWHWPFGGRKYIVRFTAAS